MVKHLLERESLGSTSIGRGIAFPHSRAPVVKEPAVALGISQTGIEYGSMDGQPVFVFFLLVAPENAAAEQMKNMSLISGFMRETDCARKIKAASNPGEVMNVLRTKILS
jgi:mannitol/fructose-specific phosphotransferase system IIA component (Ntr-type)